MMNRNHSGEPSYIARQHMARDAAEARHADRVNEANVLRRQARAAHVALTQVTAVAGRDWHAQNDPIPAPKAFGGLPMHPTRVAALTRLLADLGWSDDPREPCERVPTLAAMIEAATVGAKRDLSDAEHALLEYEADRAGFSSVDEYVADKRRRQLEAEKLHAERAARQLKEDIAAGRAPRVLFDPADAVVPD